jgi:hypothetical protein
MMGGYKEKMRFSFGTFIISICLSSYLQLALFSSGAKAIGNHGLLGRFH